MNKYTGITIGPIIKTLLLARKPRELWSASYLLSYLMRCIINEIEKYGEIISPAKLDEKDNKVGLYPDRVFLKKQEEFNEKQFNENVFKAFYETKRLKFEDKIKDYFNIGVVSIEACSDSSAIIVLNEKLNILELCCSTVEGGVNDSVFHLLKCNESPLFEMAFGSSKRPIETLAQIATAEFNILDREDLNEIKDFSGKIGILKKEFIGREDITDDEDYYYQYVKETFPEKYKSYHKYICVVQSDGDNMGKLVENAKDGELNKLSKALLQFGKNACCKIENFGGLPIFAGGDDLLFIAPVVGKKGENIFDLIENIDMVLKDAMSGLEIKNEKDGNLHTTMTYGVSITYFKYPLYEALESARNLLFDEAKNIKGKNAIALSFQKHSGATFNLNISKKIDAYTAFRSLLSKNINQSVVSAVAHKIRVNRNLLELCINKDEKYSKSRLDAFYKNIMEYSKKNDAEKQYLNNTKDLLSKLNYSKDSKKVADTMFPMLRIAKFINGEEE